MCLPLVRATTRVAPTHSAARHLGQRPTDSSHRSALREGGLVSVRREGRFTYWRVHPTGLRPLVNWIEHYQAFWLDRLAKLKTLMQELEE